MFVICDVNKQNVFSAFNGIIIMQKLNILCSVWLKAPAIYLAFNLRGPKTAPRAHMGRPV